MLAVLHVCAFVCVSHVGVCGVCVREGGGQGPLDPPLISKPTLAFLSVQPSKDS